MAEKTTTIVMVARDMASGNIAKVRGELHGLGTAGKVGALGLGGLGLAANKAESALGHAKSQIGGLVSSVGMLGGAFAAGGLVAGIGAATGAAMNFQAAMELIATQAGGTQQEVESMSAALLKLAPQVATGPDALAASLYHVESAGIRGAKALDMVRIAAEGARVGHADLEAVTNALVAETQSGVKGVTSMSQAMGVLNSIVGAGNMRMDDLTAAFGTGLLTKAKVFGANIQSVGAALADMTRQGVPAVDAAVEIGSAFRLMGGPTKAATTELKSIGLGQLDLANAMRGSNGIVGAIELLRQHMIKAGLIDAAGNPNSKGAELLVKAFGGKQSTAIMALIGDFAHLKPIQDQVIKGAGAFGDAWAKTQQDAAFKFEKFQSALSVLAVNLGNALLPPLTQFASAAADFVSGHQDSIVNALQGAIGTAETFGHAFQTFVLPPIQMVAHAIGMIPGPIKEAAAALFLLQKGSSWLVGSGPLQWGKSLLGGLLGRVPVVGNIASAVAGVQHVWVDNMPLGGLGGAGGLMTVVEGAAGAGLISTIVGIALPAITLAWGTWATSQDLGNRLAQNNSLAAQGLTPAEIQAYKYSQMSQADQMNAIRHGFGPGADYLQLLAAALAKINGGHDSLSGLGLSPEAHAARDDAALNRMATALSSAVVTGFIKRGQDDRAVPLLQNMASTFTSSLAPSLRSMVSWEQQAQTVRRALLEKKDTYTASVLAPLLEIINASILRINPALGFAPGGEPGYQGNPKQNDIIGPVSIPLPSPRHNQDASVQFYRVTGPSRVRAR